MEVEQMQLIRVCKITYKISLLGWQEPARERKRRFYPWKRKPGNHLLNNVIGNTITTTNQRKQIHAIGGSTIDSYFNNTR